MKARYKHIIVIAGNHEYKTLDSLLKRKEVDEASVDTAHGLPTYLHVIERLLD